MSISKTLSVLAIKGLATGASEVLEIRAIETGAKALVGFLASHFTDHSHKLTHALERSMSRSWQALELALAGDSWWERCGLALARAEDKSFREQVRTFLARTPLGNLPGHGEEFRQECVRQLRAARQAKLLSEGMPSPQDLARQAEGFTRFHEPQQLLEAEWRIIAGMAEEIRRAGYPALADYLSLRPEGGQSLLVVAVRYFFRREIETDSELFQGLAFAKLEKLAGGQEEGFDALSKALEKHGQRLEELLTNVQGVVLETHADVLDMKAEMQRQGRQLRDLGAAVLEALAHHQLAERPLKPGDSLSIRNDGERQLVHALVARYRALPPEQRREAPALLNALGKLEVAAGDFEAAQRDFQEVVNLVEDPAACAEAHFNAYQAALDRGDMYAALADLLEAARLDPARFTPFPLAKFVPERILGAGGFGVAFLCQNALSGSRVVIKTLGGDNLDRDLADVFIEAQLLEQLEHPAIIRLRDCDYADPGRTRPYLVMDYFAGQTLHDYVVKNGPLSEDEFMELARPIAEGLQVAHAKGILHRDIKPANVLVKRAADGWHVKVIDFGLALREKALQDSLKSTTKRLRTRAGSSIAGTIDYAAPEQMGRLPGVAIGAYSDVYGFGKTCCYALFATPQPTFQHWQSLRPALAELLGRCLAEPPYERPSGFQSILKKFANIEALAQEAAEPPPLPREEPAEPRRPAKSSRSRSTRSVRERRREDSDDRRFEREKDGPLPRRRRSVLGTLFLTGTVLFLVVACCGFPFWMVHVPRLFFEGRRPFGGGFLQEPPPPPAVPFAQDDLEPVVAELKAKAITHPDQCHQIARRLAVTEPVAKFQADVLAGLEVLTKDRSFAHRIGSLMTALPAMGKWGDKDTGLKLMAFVEDGDQRIRHPAITALGDLKEERAIKLIAGRLEERQDLPIASKVLQKFGPVVEKDVLRYTDRGKDGGVRAEACRILQEIGTTRIIPALKVLTEDTDAGIAQAAKTALAIVEAAKRAPPGQLDKNAKTDALGQALAELQGGVTEKLVVFRQLERMPVDEGRRDEVHQSLEPILKGTNHFLRLNTVPALIHWGYKDAGADLLPLLEDNDKELRHRAAEYFVKQKDVRAVPFIARRLEDNSDKAKAAELLTKMGPVAEKAVLVYAQPGKDHFVRTNACEILKAIGTPAITDDLRKLSKDGNLFVARGAQEALKAVEGRAAIAK